MDFEEFRKLYHLIAYEQEFEIIFKGMEKTYMIIKYDDHVSFLRCGVDDCSGEFEYPSLEELYEIESVDGICLKDSWDKIDTIIANGIYDIFLQDELGDFKRFYNHRVGE